jgi:hypothetical protein
LPDVSIAILIASLIQNLGVSTFLLCHVPRRHKGTIGRCEKTADVIYGHGIMEALALGPNELTPINRPSSVKSGPPEFPGLIGVCV